MKTREEIVQVEDSRLRSADVEVGMNRREKQAKYREKALPAASITDIHQALVSTQIAPIYFTLRALVSTQVGSI